MSATGVHRLTSRVLQLANSAAYGLASADPHGFDERSTSLMNRLWRHERRLEATPNGAIATDEVTIQGRAPFVTAMLMPIYRAIFRHRHAQLRRQFPAPA